LPVGPAPGGPKPGAEPGAALAYLESLKPARIWLGLDRVVAVLARLDHPERAYPTVHVAGTNGKGSTCAMVAAGLRAAGLRTGLYTSPHLIRFQERIAVDGAAIEDEALVEGVARIREAAAEIPLTYFEFGTALAFWYFRRRAVAVAVLETGLGGRLDATNVVTPIATGISALALDHTQILGPTLADIAREKAGILKPGVPCALARPPPEAWPVISARAAELGAPLHLEGRDFSLREGRYQGARWHLERVEVGLRGPHQIENGALALALLELSGDRLPLTPEAAREGLRRVVWPGRLEVVSSRGATVVLDGAHNPQGAEALARALQSLWPGRPLTLLFGVLEDKDAAPMIRSLFPLARRALLVPPSAERARPPASYQAEAAKLCPDVQVAESVGAAINRALESSQPEELLVVCGSLYLVGEARACLGLS
jgi:dihydrofolate synthase/folylpolyglutamate synthase